MGNRLSNSITRPGIKNNLLNVSLSDPNKLGRWGNKTVKQPEYFLALGYEGQYVFVLPHHNMVVVFKSRFENARDILIPKALVEEFLLN